MVRSSAQPRPAQCNGLISVISARRPLLTPDTAPRHSSTLLKTGYFLTLLLVIVQHYSKLVKTGYNSTLLNTTQDCSSSQLNFTQNWAPSIFRYIHFTESLDLDQAYQLVLTVHFSSKYGLPRQVLPCYQVSKPLITRQLKFSLTYYKVKPFDGEPYPLCQMNDRQIPLTLQGVSLQVSPKSLF